MKKILVCVLLVTMMISCLPSVTSFAGGDIKIVVDDKVLETDQPPVLVNDRTLVPLRAIFEALGASVDWNNDTNTATGVLGEKTVEIQIENTTAKVNGKDVTLDVPAKLINDRTLVPVRFISESLGCSVSWDDSTQTVNISTSYRFDQNPYKFIRSSDPYDLIYYDEGDISDPAAIYKSFKGGEIIADNDKFVTSGLGGSQYGTKTVVSVSGMDFDKAINVNVKEVPDKVYSIQLRLPLGTPDFKKDDIIVAAMYFRTLSGGVPETKTGMTQLVLEQKPSNAKLLQGSISASDTWQFGIFATKMAANNTSEINLNMRLGYYVQEVEIGGVEIVNFKNSITLDDIPRTEVYNGQEKDAQWRKDAIDRIEKIRKTDIEIKTVDKDGNPIKNAKVSLNMKKHEFKWGTMINDKVLKDTEDDDLYRKAISSYFNCAVLGNELKWKYYDENPKMSSDLIDYLNSVNIPVRGHVIWWESLSSGFAVPQNLRDLVAAGDKEGARKLVEEHTKKIVSENRGKVTDWDMFNELVNNKSLREFLGSDILVDVYKWAREADPDVKLYISETGIVGTDHVLDSFFPIIDEYKANGGGYDGFCIHGHFGTSCDPMDFYNQINQIAERYDANVMISEFDYNCADVIMQADFTRDILIACFSNENVEGFYCWGFIDKSHWQKNAPLFYSDWTLKPSGEQYVDLVYNKWMTRESGSADENGIFKARGFYGDYEITVTDENGNVKKAQKSFYKNGENSVVIALD